MPIIRVQASFGATGGAAEDVVTNTLHFEGPSDGDWENLADIVEDFYTSDYTYDPVVSYFPASRFDGSLRLRMYNLSDAEPRPPVFERLITFTPTGAAALPNEVALVMSYFAQPVAGVQRGRLRGRIYLGPIIAGANSSEGRPSATLVNSVCEAGGEMGAAAQASIQWEWCVWSRVSSTPYAVERVRVDNEWDTQRRRGLRGTGFAEANQGTFTPIT